MNVLVYLVPMALALGLTGLAAFLWSLRSGQYQDMEGAALRVLSDDDVTQTPHSVQPPVCPGWTARKWRARSAHDKNILAESC
jgi:cbb3-type cytochrome oxidase maturation protein